MFQFAGIRALWALIGQELPDPSLELSCVQLYIRPCAFIPDSVLKVINSADRFPYGFLEREVVIGAGRAGDGRLQKRMGDFEFQIQKLYLNPLRLVPQLFAF